MGESVFDRDRRIRKARLSMPQTFFLVTINQYIGNNADAWPSQAAIACAMNSTKRAVQKWQAELEAAGVLEVHSGKGCNLSNHYRLNLSRLLPKGELDSSLNSESYSSFSEPNSEPHSSGIANDVRLNSEPRAHKKNKNNQKKEQAFYFPPELRSEEFKIAWQSWVEFRREMRKKLTPSTITKQLKLLATFGDSKAVRSIDRSIMQGWQGLFDPDKNASQSTAANNAAEQAWQELLEALKNYSRFKPDEIKGAVCPLTWKAATPIGLKKIDEANDFDLREMRKRFIQNFNGQVGVT